MRVKTELWHYASKYYDPVKAHEYYMRRRILKGRASRSSVRDRLGYQQVSAPEVKEKYSTTAPQIGASPKNERKNNDSDMWDSKLVLMQRHKARMNNAIGVLQRRLSKMTPEQKKLHFDSISKIISRLREANTKEKERLTAAYNTARNGVNQ